MKLSDIVDRINGNVDRFTTDLEYYIGGEHIDSCELEITRGGNLKENLGKLGFKFHFAFQDRDVIFMARNPHLRKAGMVMFSGLCSDASYILRSKDENIITQEFLAVQLQSDHFWDYCERTKVGSVNFANNWTSIANYEFDLPSIDKQKKIAKKVWAAYNLKKSYRKLLSATQEMVKSRFVEMFSSVPKVDINCMVDTIWGSSPDSKTYNDNGEGVPFYQGKTEFGDIYINEASTFCTAPIRMAKQHAILMSVRAPVGAVNIATQDCCIGRGLASITPKVGKSITMFVFYALKYMEDEIERLGTGSTFKAINKDSYAKIQMPDVDIEKQIEFVKIAEQADKSGFELRKSIDVTDRKSLIKG